ncbi:unnamed protein product [Urochloa humidicola]
MKEATDVRVPIHDIEAKVFKVFLYFIYTDSIPNMDEGEDKAVMAQHLLVVADRYGMESLRLICEDMLCNFVDASMVAATTLVLAEQHGYHGLKEACFKFLKSDSGNLNTLWGAGFQHVKSSCPYLLEELLAMVAL